MALLIVVVFAACRSPAADAFIAQQMKEMADELNASRQDMAILQGQLDSVRTIVARQDTLLRQLAGMAGVPVVQR